MKALTIAAIGMAVLLGAPAANAKTHKLKAVNGGLRG